MTTSFRMVFSLRLLIEENVNLVILSCDYYSKGTGQVREGSKGTSTLLRAKGRAFDCVLMSPRPRLMGALICEDLRRRIRHLKVSFHHSHGPNTECAANNKECEIPNHPCSLRQPKHRAPTQRTWV
jgi:hypothetical protein